MMVRHEHERLQRRFGEIVEVSVSLAVVAGILLAVANGPFVQVWTAGELGWAPWNDLLLAIWLVTTIAVKLHLGFIGQTKAFHFMRYIYFLEGMAFICLNVLLHRFGGVTMMLALSIACSLCFSLPYGLARTREYFRLSWHELAQWHRGGLVLAAAVAPIAVLLYWCLRNQDAKVRLVSDAILGIWAGIMYMRFGLGNSLRDEACRHVPRWARPIFGGNRVSQSEA